MATDKIKFLIFLKVFFLVIYILYAIFSGELNSKTKSNELNLYEKSFLLKEVCLGIFGGSNVKWGISAAELNFPKCPAKNYGVDNEGGSFENYRNWFSIDLKSQEIIYSYMLFWAQKNQDKSTNTFNFFPNTAILSEIKKLILPSPSIAKSEYNSFGDLVNYDCGDKFLPLYLNKLEFAKNNESVAIETNKRLNSIINLTKTKEVIVRIPPVYVSELNLYSYKSLMKSRIEVFRALGINVINTTIVSSDKSLFCDAPHHPNPKGRSIFTIELKEKLNSLGKAYSD
jgi:hypothetical protein